MQIRHKLFLSLGAMAVLSGVAGFIAVTINEGIRVDLKQFGQASLEKPELIEQATEALAGVRMELTQPSAPGGRAPDAGKLASAMEKLHARLAQCRRASEDGLVLAQKDGDPAEIGQAKAEIGQAEALERELAQLQASLPPPGAAVPAAGPVPASAELDRLQEGLGLYRATASRQAQGQLTEVEGALKHADAVIFWSSILLLMLGAGIAVFAARALARPIQSLTIAVRKISQGDHDAKLPPNAGDEFGVLSDGFNRMLEQIGARDAALRAARDNLEQRVEEARAALKATLAQFTAIWENAPLSIMLFEPNDPAVPVKIVDCNPMACQLHGYTREELVGRSVDVVEATPWSQNAPNWIAQLRSQRSAEGEALHRRKDGTVFPIDYFTSLLNVGGRELVIGMDHDATARREAEVRLAYERDQLRALLDTIPDTIYFKDRESRFVRVSRSKVQQAIQTLPDIRQQRAKAGLSPDVAEAELLTGLSDFDTHREEDARLAREDELAIINTGNAVIGKLEKQSFQDGAVRWCLSSKMAWRNHEGKIIGTVGISKDITDLKAAEQKLELMHRELLATSRQAGMAEVATGVLHNVGNVLNSVNVSATLVADQVRRSKAVNLTKISAMLDQHKDDLPEFLRDDPKGKIIPAYLGTLSEHLATERQAMVTELENLRKNIEHIKEIVSMQQNYAKTSGVNETVSIPDMVEDALRINAGSLARHDVDIARDYVDRPVATLDKHKVIQILINLIRNAKYACDESGRPDKLITVRTTADDERVRIVVSDNGIGIPEENLTRIFAHGFTTRSHGHGFGLHSGALAAKELGGALVAQSKGRGHGAVFTLELPFKPPHSNHAEP